MSASIDFIGIGVARSGTSWIANCLRHHSQICFSEPKEVRYFKEFELAFDKEGRRPNPHFSKDLDWYLKRFHHARVGQIRGEYSPIYFHDKMSAVRIQQHYPSVKLLLCLRNPVDRAYSHYLMHRASSALGDITFEDALKQYEFYKGMGLYAAQLQRYLDRFDRQQLLVLIFEELVRDPEFAIRKILQFLGVSCDIGLDLTDVPRNEPANVRSAFIRKVAYSASQKLVDTRLSSLLDAFRKYGAHSLFNKLNTTSLNHRPINEETRRKLVAYFGDDISDLEKMLGREFSDWKEPQ